jgi:putative hydrolase of the HAD superfamily
MLCAVTLDLTGTLIHAPRLGEIYSQVLARHGVEVEPQRAAGLVGEVWRELDCAAHPARERFGAHPEGARGWWRRLLERFCERLGEPDPGPFAAAELFESFARGDSWEVYSEVPEALTELRRMGLALGLISNWDERLPRLLVGLDLPSFDTVVYSQEVGVEKPHRRIFVAALERLGLPPAQTLHVGDSRRRDIEGARAVGMHALHLDRHGGGGDLAELAELASRIPAGRW